MPVFVAAGHPSLNYRNFVNIMRNKKEKILRNAHWQLPAPRVISPADQVNMQTLRYIYKGEKMKKQYIKKSFLVVNASARDEKKADQCRRL
jgi:hypothetical protein